MSDPHFVEVNVVLSWKEYLEIRHERALLGPGTFSAAIRKRMGMSVEPRGIKKWLKEQPDGS